MIGLTYPKQTAGSSSPKYEGQGRILKLVHHPWIKNNDRCGIALSLFICFPCPRHGMQRRKFLIVASSVSSMDRRFLNLRRWVRTVGGFHRDGVACRKHILSGVLITHRKRKMKGGALFLKAFRPYLAAVTRNDPLD